MPGRNYSSPSYRYGFNGQEKDDEVKGDGNSLDFGARVYDPRIGRFMSVDPMSAKFSMQSPYVFAANSPLMFKDKNGEYAVSVHFNITYMALIKIGYSKEFSYTTAHYASIYADHPPHGALIADNLTHGTGHGFRSDIDYTPTANSQEEENSMWHSMMSDEEKANGMTHEQAMKRGLSFGWDNIMAQKEGLDMGKLGQGIHALQDAYAHQGAATNEHLGANLSSLNMFYNDLYGNTAKAQLITESAAAVISLFEPSNGGNAFKDGMKLDFSGMSNNQVDEVVTMIKNVGFDLESTSDGLYTAREIKQ